MSKPVSNLRLFVGIYPPRISAAPLDLTPPPRGKGDHAKALLETLKGLTLPPHRTTPIEQLHLTLHFIGDVRTRDLDRTRESVARSAAGLEPFSLLPLKLISLPPRGRARLIAIETDRPAPLLELQHRLVSRLARKVRSRPGDRFLPHLTLCRFSSPVNLQRIEHSLEMNAFEVRDLRLMRSTLSHEGAVHHELERIELGK
jgi:2'-5' RNA ligase